MKKLHKIKTTLFLIICIALSFEYKAQTTGMIIEPATGVSASILDPNGDGYISTTTLGF
ncbi:MAG: hypothetical protein HYU67_12630 [Flavobacteriia bacterium]|nr:hypothetical protein [Flavobacteriia bacterium]